ncbi:hypothetical protein Tco_0751913 [Tanacetum coccineum]|uniref:Uncharacterized protein n=1 Tax=Tanacetum coccineum TaxID=301880 RepID=A0ABQ4Z859_9ASTR
MASFDYRLNPLYTIKECSSCGALYTTDYCCSNVGLVDKIIRDPNPISYDETPDSPSQPQTSLLNQRHCFHCKDLLEEHEHYKRCTCMRNWRKFSKTSKTLPSHPITTLTLLVHLKSHSSSIKTPVKILHKVLHTLTIIVVTSVVIRLMISFVNDVLSSLVGKGFSDSNDDSTSIDDDSFSIDDIDYVEASPPDFELFSLEVVENVTPKDGEIEDDVLREKLSKINLLIAKIEALKDNPTPSSDFVTKSPSTFPNFFLEETNTFDNSLPEFETFCFDLEENSSGSTTTCSDYSLPGYEAFYLNDDHIEEKSSGSTTTHSDISLSKYDSFIFDLSNDPFPPANRSDFYHREFAYELAHIVSPPEYDCFYFKSEPDPGELTSIVDSGIRENVLSTTNVNLPFKDEKSPLLAYVVWIFLLFLTYPVTPPYLLSCGNEDTIFDPDISIYHSFMPSVSHQSGTFMKFNVYPNHLNESPMEILSSTCSPMDQ